MYKLFSFYSSEFVTSFSVTSSKPQGAALPIASSYYLTFVGVVGSPSVLQESERDRKVLEFLLWLRLLHIGGDPYFASL